MKVQRSSDFDIRAAVVRQLLAEGVARGDIRHEITLDTSSADGRADIVLLRNSSIIGIELKSGRDILDRIEKQLASYERAFDSTFVIADEVHETPLSWDHLIWHPKEYAIRQYRSASECYITHHALTRFSRNNGVKHMAKLLWKNEAVAISVKLGAACSTRYDAINWLRENASLRELRPLVIDALRARVPNRWEQTFWAKFDAPKAGAIAA